jgi:hypothetical protein
VEDEQLAAVIETAVIEAPCTIMVPDEARQHAARTVLRQLGARGVEVRIDRTADAAYLDLPGAGVSP